MQNNANKSKEKTGFGGILSGLNKLIYTDEYMQQTHATDTNNETDEVPEQQTTKITTPVVVKSSPAPAQSEGSDVEEMVKQIHEAFESMNQPGIDFLEVWNAAEAVGGITEQNLMSSFKILKTAEKTLTIDGLITSGQYYIDELRKVVGNGIKKKQGERQALINQQANESKTLTEETEALDKQITLLQTQYAQKKQLLDDLDSSYAGPIAAADQRIAVGEKGLQIVVDELQSAIDLLNKNKPS